MPDVKACLLQGAQLPLRPSLADAVEDSQSLRVKSGAAALDMAEQIKTASIDHFRLVVPKPIGGRSFRNAPFNVVLLVGRKVPPAGTDQAIHLDT